MSRGRVVVVGGGVIGAFSAYYLVRSGWSVTIVERERFGKACSHGNCGLLAVDHVLPLALPGALRQAARWVLRRDSPLRIKPRFDPSLWRWLAAFARRCNERDMLESALGRSALLRSSDALFREFWAAEAVECEWEQHGVLFVHPDRASLDAYEPTARLLEQQFDLPSTRLDTDALVHFEPAVKPDVAGAWLYEVDSHLRPDRLLSELRRLLEEAGVRIVEGAEVRGFAASEGRARAVRTTDGEIEGDHFVVALGAWTPLLAEELGCRVPIQPGKGYSITMRRPAECPRVPLIFEHEKVVVTPMKSGYRLGSTMEFCGYDTKLERRRLALLVAAARRYLKEPTGEPVEEEWCGWRPMVYDGKPVIDRSPRHPNLIIAAGHGMLGLSMATGTGRLVRELIEGEPPHIDASAYALARFAKSKT